MVGRRCIVPSCTSGYKSNPEKVHVFVVPREESLRAEWQRCIPRDNFIVKHPQVVCEKHFSDSDILREKIITDSVGNVLGVGRYERPKLKLGAVPRLFPQCPKYLSKPLKRRKSPKIRTPIPAKRVLHQYPVGEKENLEEIHSGVCDVGLFDRLYTDMKSVSYPHSWVRANIAASGQMARLILFVEFASVRQKERVMPVSVKQVTIDESMAVTCFIHNQVVDLQEFGSSVQRATDAAQVEGVVELVHKLYECQGCVAPTDVNELECNSSYVDHFGRLRHKECTLLVTSFGQCIFCSRAAQTINRKRLRLQRQSMKSRIHIRFNPRQQKNIELLRKRIKSVVRGKAAARRRLASCQEKLGALQTKFDEISEKSLQERLMELKLGKNQSTALHEILKSAKFCSSKGRRYSEDWVLLCIVLYTRSPSGYEFLRRNDILPLPCVRTIRRYLALIDTTCGFDHKFFKLLETQLRSKPKMQRHGLLLLDEMSVRESVAVNSRNLTYTGLIDMGVDGVHGQSFQEKANHGLVFMFQPLADSYTQAIGVFASRGPTKGIVLAQLLVKAIIMMEKAGAYVHGVVADGASTNLKLWAELGVSGVLGKEKSWFEHPLNGNRKIFMFSDTPHLLKNIRNRLFNNRDLKVHADEPLIKWSHFEVVHEQEKNLLGDLRVCPKIGMGHIYLSNASKMRVRLAVQVLSLSMANALRFYRTYLPELADSESTAAFCERFNSVFDALNRKLVGQGVTLLSEDYEVMKSTLKWLNDWEERVVAGEIEKKHFLTNKTADGLRLTLLSSLGMIKYLVEEEDFEYVLTGRINQDSLERFFGTIRQAGGANDHPATPTFLQLYKILSIYTLIKPPRTGNCTVENDFPPCEPVITLAEIKEIYRDPSKSESIRKTIEGKLFTLVNYEDWDFDVAVDHDYALPVVLDCILYYCTGVICKGMLQKVECVACRAAFTNPTGYSHSALARLVSMRPHSIVHPNIRLFYFIKILEELFIKHGKCWDACELILTEILERKDLSFPCNDHREMMIAAIIIQFLHLRMMQAARVENAEVGREYASRKKTLKFLKT